MGLKLRRSPEFDLISRYFSRHQSGGLDLAIGDDAAIFTPPSGHSLVFSIDTQVEGRHFPRGFPAEKIATRALGAALSDLAAMGANPHHFTLALTLPEFDEDWLADFSRGLFGLADHFNIKLVGGDTTKGPLSISIQVHGLVEQGVYLARSGAKVDDEIYVSGALGDAAAGLKFALEHRDFDDLNSDEQYLYTAFSNPMPEVALGLKLLGTASAALDISDGLLADLEQLAVASGLVCEVDLDLIPLSEPLCRVEGKAAALDLALSGGDDYKLLLTVPREKKSLVKDLGLLKIGRMRDLKVGSSSGSDRVMLFRNGVFQKNPELRGFDHFG